MSTFGSSLCRAYHTPIAQRPTKELENEIEGKQRTEEHCKHSETHSTVTQAVEFCAIYLNYSMWYDQCDGITITQIPRAM